MNGGGENEMAQKGYSKTEAREGPQLAIRKKSDNGTVERSGFLQCKNQANEFLSSVGKGNVVMFALRAFLSEISGKSWIPVTDVLGCVVKSVAQVSRTSFFHVWVAIF